MIINPVMNINGGMLYHYWQVKMCIAIPGKVLAVEGGLLTVEFQGLKKSVKPAFKESVKAGDYVLVRSDLAVGKLSEREALESISLWDELVNV